MLEPLLPIVAVGAATSVISKTVVGDATQLDGATLVPLGLAVVAMIFVGRWIFTYSRDCERQRAKIAAQTRLLKYLVNKSRDVNENDPYVRQLLTEVEKAGEKKDSEDDQ